MDGFSEPIEPGLLKRKRSRSSGSPRFATPPMKVSRNAQHTTQLEINYLARQNEEDIPLITAEDTMPSVLHLINQYNDVLERHESLAYNLGARPLGPILIKRFERLFDGPPTTLKTHVGRDGHAMTINWLDVIDFARAQPDQFILGQIDEGVRACQFYTKQCRVQVSEEDFLLIQSGLPQKMIPPQPIAEDEEKELGTLDIVEWNVQQITSLADQVAARARQFNHKLRSRKQAIIDRRASDTAVSGAVALRAASPSNVALMNGVPVQDPASPSGFAILNNRPIAENHADQQGVNGPEDAALVSQSTRDDLLKSFFTVADHRQPQIGMNGISNPCLTPSASVPSVRTTQSIRRPRPAEEPRSSTNDDQQVAASLLSYNPDHVSSTPTPYQATPSPATPQTISARQSTNERDDGGIYRMEMVARLESVAKGDRISPPCDRCRRLHMECLKNLTACMGCTKKHAKCSWKSVKEEELKYFSPVPAAPSSLTVSGGGGTSVNQPKIVQLGGNRQGQQRSRHNKQSSYGKQGRTHDQEIQAARSLAMAAVADTAIQAQMQMQKNTQTDTPHANASSEDVSAPAELSNRTADHSNVDPSLQSVVAHHGVRVAAE